MTMFDPSEYMRSPVLTVSGGVTLARALVALKPKQTTEEVNRTARKLAEVAGTAQDAMVQREEAAIAGDENSRAVDTSTDLTWQALEVRLHAYTLLSADEFPVAERAKTLLSQIFTDEGLAFLRQRYPVQFTLADNIIKRIKKHNLQNEIDALAGPDFLKAVLQQHERYEQMVHGILSRSRGDEENLHDHLRNLKQAITNYAVAVCATADEDKPETVETVRTILQPILNYRQANLRNRNTNTPGQPDAEPDNPDEPTDTDESAGSARPDEPK